jgi:hypothetical protein
MNCGVTFVKRAVETAETKARRRRRRRGGRAASPRKVKIRAHMLARPLRFNGCIMSSPLLDIFARSLAEVSAAAESASCAGGAAAYAIEVCGALPGGAPVASSTAPPPSVGVASSALLPLLRAARAEPSHAAAARAAVVAAPLCACAWHECAAPVAAAAAAVVQVGGGSDSNAAAAFAALLTAARRAQAFAGAVQSVSPTHAKWGEIWEHRRWLAAQVAAGAARLPAAGGGRDSAAAAAAAFYHDEVRAGERACARYPRCYTAWTHRWLCVRDAGDAVLLRELRGGLARAALLGGRDASAAHFRLQALRTLRAPALLPVLAELPLLDAQLRAGAALATRYALRSWAAVAAGAAAAEAAAAAVASGGGACAACVSARVPALAAAAAAAAVAAADAARRRGAAANAADAELQRAAAAVSALLRACACASEGADYARAAVDAAQLVA